MVAMHPETKVQNCDIKSHMNTHTGEEACSYSQGTEGSESFEHRSPQANNGDSESPGEADAKNNMKLLENAKKPYTCSICNKSFA